MVATPKLLSESDQEALLAMYRAPNRAYHNEKHLRHVLQEVVGAETGLDDASAVCCALWFHDAIYDTRAKDNEEKSAELADQVLAKAGANQEFRNKVRHLIMMTKHNAIPQTEEEAIVVGADLAILGAPEDEFWKYEEAIRKEYAWVPEQAYRAARSVILKQFLDRPAIFTHPHFAAKYETQARKNLSASLARLVG